MTIVDDEDVLRRIVGSAALTRGRDYALHGAVLTYRWDESGRQLFGRVQGNARSPYTSHVVITRSPTGALTSFRGACTCPVGTDCKHSVALLLSAQSSHRPPGAPPAVAVAPWERSLAGLVRGGTEQADDAGIGPAVALQFELVLPGEKPVRAGEEAHARILLRPVLPGRGGGWVRTGVSWSDLQYMSYSRRGIDPAHLRLLGEILAVGSAGIPGYHPYSNKALQLESIGSRRIWDLLAEARSLGLPLVQAGREGAPVTLSTDPVELALDLTRSDGGLSVQPVASVGGEHIVLAASLPIGDPASGIAWWQSSAESEPLPRTGLRLARLAAPLDASLRALVYAPALRVPGADEPRFFSTYYPTLRARMPMTSTDGSVPLPEPEPLTLLLEIEHLGGHRVHLAWHWASGSGGSRRREPLWADRRAAAIGRDREAERAFLDVVADVVGAFPALFEPAGVGGRLAPVSVLDGLDTVRFSTEVLPRLAGLEGLTVEETGSAPSYREAEGAPVVEISGSAPSDDRDWFDLAVTVSVDGEDVPFEELFVALSTGCSHLLLPSGTYFSLDVPELQELADLIAEARALQESPTGTVRLSRFQAGLWEELERLGVISGQAAQWQKTVVALTGSAAMAEVPVPAGLHAVLRPYQQAGFNWLAFLFANRLGGILADEMGLGKTLQALALLCHVKEHGLSDAPFLIVAPTSVVPNWVSECHRFAPGLRVAEVTETQARRAGVKLAEVVEGADVVVTSYALFRLGYEEYAGLEWAGLALDEAQFVKNHQSKGYQCAKRLPAPFKLAITGTPMENHLMELWSLLSITAPGLFPSPARFEKYYRTPIEKGKDAELLAQLRRRVRPLMLRRSKEQVAHDLPRKQEQVVMLELNPRHRRVYQTYLQRERQKVLGLLGDLEKNRFEIFRSLTLLRQASLDAGLVDPRHAHVPSTKLDALDEMLTEITEEGHRALVFSQFTRFLQEARDRVEAAGIDYCYLDGSTRRRAAVLEAFREGKAPVFLISLKAGGFGLNLTEADYCILLDPWWNPATEAQAVDRVHRIGQKKKVMVYRLVAKDTIEEKVMALKARKAALFGSVMEGDDFSSGKFTAADIRGMLE